MKTIFLLTTLFFVVTSFFFASSASAARLWSSGLELQALSTLSNSYQNEWYSISGTVSISTIYKRSGDASLRANPSAGTGYARKVFGYNNPLYPEGYIRFYLYISQTTGSSSQIMQIQDNSGTAQYMILLDNNRQLELREASAGRIGSLSSVLAKDKWYRVEIYWNDSSGSNDGTLTARLNGTEFASGNHNNTADSGRLLLGVITSTTADLYFDDVAINSTSGSYQNSWPGEGKIVHLMPNAAGDSNSWQKGDGSSGDSNNYQLVDEVPLDTGTTSMIKSNTLNAEDMYNVSAMPEAISSVNAIHAGAFNRRGDYRPSAYIRMQIKKESGGTIAQEGSQWDPYYGDWVAYHRILPFLPGLTLYRDPDGSDWTDSTLDSMQVGVKVTEVGDYDARINVVWALVDYNPIATSEPTPDVIFRNPSSQHIFRRNVIFR